MATSLPEQKSYGMSTKSANQRPATKKRTARPGSTLKSKHSSSIAISFLNTITMDQAIALKSELMAVDTYEHLINPKHISSKITLNELPFFTNKKIHNGQFLHDFMTCLIKPNHIDQPSPRHSLIDFTPDRTAWSSVQQATEKFCTSHSIKKLPIPNHYICLRARLSTFPVELSTGEMQISRLCTTDGCIEDEHLVIENTSISTTRQHCHGIHLVLQPYGPTPYKHIIKIEPCTHGLQHPDADGDFLRYSCRKITVSILDEISMAYLASIHKTNSC